MVYWDVFYIFTNWSIDDDSLFAWSEKEKEKWTKLAPLTANYYHVQEESGN